MCIASWTKHRRLVPLVVVFAVLKGKVKFETLSLGLVEKTKIAIVNGNGSVSTNSELIRPNCVAVNLADVICDQIHYPLDNLADGPVHYC